MQMQTREPQKFKEALSRWKEKESMPGRLFFEIDGCSINEKDETVYIMLVTYQLEE